MSPHNALPVNNGLLETPRRLGTSMPTVRIRFDFPRDEVFVFLKQRKRTLSLHGLHDFIGVEKYRNFSYEVLLGDCQPR
jgi:hypothetical protein